MEHRFVKPLVIFKVFNFQKIIIINIKIRDDGLAIFKNVGGFKVEKI